jgi:hypothetical protein
LLRVQAVHKCIFSDYNSDSDTGSNYSKHFLVGDGSSATAYGGAANTSQMFTARYEQQQLLQTLLVHLL